VYLPSAAELIAARPCLIKVRRFIFSSLKWLLFVPQSSICMFRAQVEPGGCEIAKIVGTMVTFSTMLRYLLILGSDAG
jgi:hypothetical protein